MQLVIVQTQQNNALILISYATQVRVCPPQYLAREFFV
jgi:hypothetical protein